MGPAFYDEFEFPDGVRLITSRERPTSFIELSRIAEILVEVLWHKGEFKFMRHEYTPPLTLSASITYRSRED